MKINKGLLSIIFLTSCISIYSSDQRQKEVMGAILESGLSGNKSDTFEVVKKAVNDDGNKVDLNFIDVDNGATPLTYALNNANPKLINYLIQQGADVNMKNGAGDTPLFEIISLGGLKKWRISEDDVIDIMKILLNAGADFYTRCGSGYTPLIWAMLRKLTKVVKFLIERGVDVNQKDIDGDTPLATAEQRGLTEMIKILKDAGAKE